MKTSIWDLLAILGMVAAVSVASVFALIFTDPYTALNPFPPPTLPPTVAIPTSTATPRSLPATWTPTTGSGSGLQGRPSSTPVPTLTSFRLPTWTFTPTRTRTPVPTAVPTRTSTRTSTLAPTSTINGTMVQQTVVAAVAQTHDAETLAIQLTTNAAISQIAAYHASQTADDAASQTADFNASQTADYAASQTADCETLIAQGTPCP